MKTIAVVGKNFGDEGKGLVTASLCAMRQRPLIVRHNGGAQAGHTVEDMDKGTRFVHHQTGSGAEHGAPTLLAASFHPDLYMLGREISEFEQVYGFRPRLYAEPEATPTTIDDVLLNMAIETHRGEDRHGSCGMGINECCERITAGFSLTMAEVCRSSVHALFERLEAIRGAYALRRAGLLGLDMGAERNPYAAMLADRNVLVNFAEEVSRNAALAELTPAGKDWLAQFDTVLFETGQGLLLDAGCERFAPHVTASRTGAAESVRFLQQRGMDLDEVVYVTRTYVTRHGAGPLPCECPREALQYVQHDRTNEPNEWQGSIRYAPHESMEAFLEPLLRDVAGTSARPSLAVTHLDETHNTMYFSDGRMSFDALTARLSPKLYRIFGARDRERLYVAASRP